MQAQGAPDDVIEAEQARLAEQREPALLWPENQLTAEVFLMCQLRIHVGMAGVIYQGVDAQEIDAAARLLRVPPSERAGIAWGVRLMASAAADVLNSRRRD